MILCSFFVISVSMYVIYLGVAGRQPYCGYVAPPISTSISIYVVHVLLFDMYKEL